MPDNKPTKVCEIEGCRKEFTSSQGYKLHMTKSHNFTNEVVNQDTPVNEFVTKEKFDGLVASVEALTGLIKESLVKKEEKTNQVAVDASIEPDKGVVPPKWREIVDQVLGSDFGVNVVYPDKGRGFLFKVIVPREKSNASDAHWKFYHADIRTRAITFADGAEGIKRYCEAVAKNLKLDKRYIVNAPALSIGSNKLGVVQK